MMEQTKKSYTFEEIKQKLVNYCVYQDRCHDEVERKMREFLLIPEAKDEIILFLIKENYLNEERFVRSYIRGNFNIKKWGRIKIRMHLKQKGISDKLILKCMDEIDEDQYLEAIKIIWNNYYLKHKALKDWQKRSKTISYLISRGYEYELVKDIYRL